MYVLIHTAAWVAVSQTDRWEDSFPESMTLGLDVLPIIGIPTLLIAVFAVSVHKRMGVVRFRLLLALPLTFCAWPLLYTGPAEIVCQVMAQIAFAALIPAPLFPQRWLGKTDG
ncbi:hypothetical protein ACIPXV_31610 [Streptomyces libani]|uniref:hypothetical protein n=1 Tax=Streptomyces TaxID=1883 RepID=UPI00140F1D4B|nr:hypothetical protein [Streptomyces sp. ID38640]QIK07868.1 hypothetical protein G7Z12_19250 [Streptomyces sp. ID38640]